MAAPRPRVFNIPPSAPFLPTLIEALVQGKLVAGFAAAGDPLALASATIYLPTRRACRMAQDLFLDVLGSKVALLPQLVAIGDIDEDELIFTAPSGASAAEALFLPPAIGGLERRLLLARLIQKWAQSPEVRGAGNTPLVANTPASALALADALAQLGDDMATRGAAWDALDRLVPENHDPYWQITLEFLKIARRGWEAILAADGAMEPALRRDKLIAAEAGRLQTAQSGPVIAAGSTGSMPATAMLLGTIARLPHGAVVLPGLDTHLDEPSWRLIGGASVGSRGDALAPCVVHPQFAMHGLLTGLSMHREEVIDLAPASPQGRERLVSEALRPAAATELWSTQLQRDGVGAALEHVAVIEAANTEEEALVIAIALREAVETPGKTAALITPDRPLARRVIAALGRWNVEVDDSGGDALSDTQAGVFARLAAEAALSGLEPVTLLALLKHPLLRLGDRDGGHAEATSLLERAVLRGPRPRAGTGGLAQALASLQANRTTLHPADPRSHLTDDEIESAAKLVRRLAAALSPLEQLGPGPRPLAHLVQCHRDVLRALAADGVSLDAVARDDVTMLLDLLEGMSESEAAEAMPVRPTDYPEVFRAAMDGQVVRRAPHGQARVRIFGLLEARLQHVDRVVLGALVEGIWPPQTRSDPWLSRPMRHALGLDLPERRIGLTAHDFAQALGAHEVILSRASKVGGAPTVRSRFVQRLAAVAGDQQWDATVGRGARYVELARSLDRPAQVMRIKPPEPRPPRAARPSRLSVTEIEHWLRDPYTIYAKHILRLAPLEAVDTPPGARDRGNVIHAAIADFTVNFADRLPPDPLEQMLALGRKSFAPLAEFPEARAFWWPRFERIARWFAGWELRRRENLEAVHAEIRGEIEIPAGERTFLLSARADRIERLGESSYALLDYKTGQIATARQVRSGLAPQLTLEATILQRGGFKEIPAGGRVDALSYVQLKGGEPAGEEREIAWTDTTPETEAGRAFTRLCGVIARFEDPSTPYRPLAHPMWATRYGDYDHLARVKEWSETGLLSEVDPAAGPTP